MKVYFQDTLAKDKAYKCLNLSTHKIIESAHVKVDEFVEKAKEERKNEPKDYRRFVNNKTHLLIRRLHLLSPI